MSDLLIPVSIGELIDKITILELKKQKIIDPNKLINIINELDKLVDIKSTLNIKGIEECQEKLFAVNEKLWEVEDDLRELEKKSIFDSHFIDLARSVYKLNDLRSKIKKQINLLSGSSIIEEKSYVE